MSELEIERRIATRPSPELAAIAELDRREAAHALGPQGNPVDRVSCRLGDGSCAQAHAMGVSRNGSSATHSALLRLQRKFGNRYVGVVLSRARADDAVDGHDAVERSIDQARGGGQGLDHRTRRQMESSFGADFSGVRIHTDSRADELNTALSARAFATGQDVFFKQGEYDPGSSKGRELLAHELTHVVQQSADEVRAKLTVSQPDDEHELEADRVAQAVMQREQESASSPDDEKENEVGKAGELGSVHRQPEATGPEEDDAERALDRSTRSRAGRLSTLAARARFGG